VDVTEAWLESVADADEAAELTARLVAIRSYPGAEGRVQRVVFDWLSAAGLAPEELATGEAERPNVIARIENGPGPTLLLNGHVDTVLAVEGWTSDPWTPQREGDRLLGLGACDMKSGVAAAMLATRALARARDRWRGTVLFTSVVDEEAYSLGARALIASGLQADYCVVTEASWDEPCLGGVGKALIRAEVTGRSAHATWPGGGINAAVEAARLAVALERVPVGRHPRIEASQTVLSIHAGPEQYVMTVPDAGTLLINRHLVPGESADDVLEQYRELAAGLGSEAHFDLTLQPPYYPSWEISPDHPFVGAFARAYSAETGRQPTWGYRAFGDANLFSAAAGIPTVQFGPRGGNFHQADEWVDVPSIAGTVRVLCRLALDVLPRTE
jgi:acetylornithine deacetylase/succinyl-diaminopimelate desuccinylase-like protein